MKTLFTKKIINAIQVVIFVLLPAVMFAPPLPPNPGGTSPSTPIDGGLIFLLVAGVSYGIKLALDARTKNA